ncbi:hypothetical protein AB0F24_17495 [Streptomyces platensis]|uniref:hypothetical protein n=1 Tax=Streptomyces platensis TaxID=58346 RepID=UPI0033CEDF35
MERILTAVPFPRTDGKGWGVICPDHPLRRTEPTDYDRHSAEAFAEAVACGHEAHKDEAEVTLTSTTVAGQTVRLIACAPTALFPFAVDIYAPSTDEDEFDFGTPVGTPVLVSQASFDDAAEARAEFAAEVVRLAA